MSPGKKSSLAPLLGDASRQSPDLHKGIVFQIWKSVEAWITLPEDALLFLEGAEDFDVSTPSGGISSQVKATSGNITLRNEAVIGALNSFWTIRNNHKDRSISLRFITTSSVGGEAENPFGSETKGLELWQKCCKSGDMTIAETLRDFLLNDPSISTHIPAIDEGRPGSLRHFLRTASPDELISGLFRCIVFECEVDDSDAVKESLKIQLRSYGERFGVFPSEAERVLDRLYRIAAETASRKHERSLSRDDFRKCWEGSTSRTYSQSQLALITSQASLAQQLAQGAIGTSGAYVIIPSSMIQDGIPELGSYVLKRGPSLFVVGEFMPLFDLYARNQSPHWRNGERQPQNSPFASPEGKRHGFLSEELQRLGRWRVAEHEHLWYFHGS